MLHFSVSTYGLLLFSTNSSHIYYYVACSLAYGYIEIHFFGHVLTHTEQPLQSAGLIYILKCPSLDSICSNLAAYSSFNMNGRIQACGHITAH